MPQTRIRKRLLPHWECERGVYFVTFRLADSLPRSVLESMQRTLEAARSSRDATEENRTAKMAVLPGALSAQLRNTGVPPVSLVAPPSWRSVERGKHQRVLEDYLDRGAGACYLKQPEIAEVVAQALRAFHGRRNRLLAWCIMPNHVHVVFQPNAPFDLRQILHSWKSYSGLRANTLLKRTGRFWQREYYDHLIRDGQELGRAIRYTVENPIKARLRNWPWVFVAKDWS